MLRLRRPRPILPAGAPDTRPGTRTLLWRCVGPLPRPAGLSGGCTGTETARPATRATRQEVIVFRRKHQGPGLLSHAHVLPRPSTGLPRAIARASAAGALPRRSRTWRRVGQAPPALALEDFNSAMRCKLQLHPLGQAPAETRPRCGTGGATDARATASNTLGACLGPRGGRRLVGAPHVTAALWQHEARKADADCRRWVQRNSYGARMPS